MTTRLIYPPQPSEQQDSQELNVKDTPMSEDSYAASKNKLFVGVAFALFIVLLGSIVIFQSKQYGFGGEEDLIGPGTAPILLGALLIVGGLMIALKDLLSLKRLKAQHTEQEVSSHKSGRAYMIKSFATPIGIIFIFLAGIYLSQYTGVLVTLSLTVFVCGLVIERLTVLKSVILALVTLLIGYGLFEVLLSAQFPESMVGF